MNREVVETGLWIDRSLWDHFECEQFLMDRKLAGSMTLSPPLLISFMLYNPVAIPARATAAAVHLTKTASETLIT